MNSLLRDVAIIALLIATCPARAESSWSAQNYDLYPGDFNGDGLTDLLYISKDPARPSGIALSDGTGFNVSLQMWGNAYLGIPWTDGTYNIVVADFDGDGKADLLLQRKVPGDNFLLLTGDGGVEAISQTIPKDAAGLAWSADQHQIIAGDFNGDGKADLFFQPTDAKGLGAIILADLDGQFTAKRPAQSWDDGYAGLRWASTEVQVYSGDFNGDGRGDLLVQSYPITGTGPGTSVPAQFEPNTNGVLLAQSGRQLFGIGGLQAWSRNGFGADWSPLISVVVVGDFNADGRSDVFLQGATSINSNYLLYGDAPGPVFTRRVVVKDKVSAPADTYRLMAGQFTSDKEGGLYFQGLLPNQTNILARLSGGAMLVTQSDAPLVTSTGLVSAAAAAPSSRSALAAMTVTSAGKTPGQFAVSAMGAATYQIPIWTPPGARGIEPHLALAYASGSPDGVMGPGWNLSGLSSIVRCNKTYADNAGLPAAVTLTMSDDFCIDGNRMRVTSGTYGAAGSVYQTQIATFSRIAANSTAGNGPSYFIVEGKDGLIYEYGNTADSKAYANGGTTPYAWMLNKVRDRQTQADNLIVTYSTTSGSVQPTSISYTQTPSTNGTTYPYSVAFTYQNRVAPNSRYIAGQNVLLPQVLSKINVQSGGVSVRQYNVNYSTAPTTQRDRVSSIQECAGSAGTDCLKPTTIAYQDGSAGLSATTTTAISESATVLAVRDFTGDGRTDILYTAAGVTKVVVATGGGYSSPYTLASGLTYTTWGDVLGSGTTDVLAVSGTNWTRFYWNGSGFTAATSLPGPTCSFPLCTFPHHAALQDIDGDGRADLLYYQVTSSTPTNIQFAVTAYMNSSTGGTLTLATTGITVLSSNMPCNPNLLQICSPDVNFGERLSSQTGMLDFDGDGRPDLVMTLATTDSNDATTYDSYLMAARGAPSVYVVLQHVTGTGANYAPFTFFGNFNRDSCTDFSSTTFSWESTCGGVPSQRANIPGISSALAVLDWDGDGQADILFSSGSAVKVTLSTSVGWSTPQTTTIPLGTLAIIDQNGDGEADVLSVGASSASFQMHSNTLTPPDLATTISDGWGIAASPTYTPITQNYYTKGTGAVFPETDITGPIYVVSQSTQSDGIGGTFNNTFWYYGARVNRQGRGFEGFSETRSQDSRNSIYGYVYYNQVFPYTGTVSKRETYKPDNTTLMARTINTFLMTDLSGAGCTATTTSLSTRCFPYLQEAVSTSYEITATHPLIQTSDSTFTYDTNGNPLTAQTATQDNDSTSPNYNQTWTSLTTNTFGTTSTTTWCFDKPTRTTTQNSITGQSPAQPTLTRTVDHAVDTTYCRFTSETTEPTSTTLKVVTNFGYDTCGNVNSVGIVGLDQNGVTMPTRTTTSSYGTRCTFPESVTNALNQTATTAYNYTYGEKVSSTDPNNVSVSWLYDNFGRRNRENRPDSTYSTWLYEDCTTSSCWTVTDNLRLRVTETRNDSAGGYVTSVLRHYDGLERLKYEAGYRVLGTLTWTRTNYDALGRKAETYLPYAAPDNGHHHFDYDLLNRPTFDKLYNASNVWDRQTQMTYAGLKTTITDARGNSTTKWTDVAGKLRRIIDPAPGGTTNYTFDVFGNLVQMVDAKTPTGATTSYTYNIRGFKTDSVDPDTGHWIYTTNSLNELITQRDAKVHDTNFVYDKLGRMTSRTDLDGTTGWVYGTSATSHNIGRLQCVIAASASNCNATSGIYREDYVFDSLGRPSTTTIVEDTNYTIGYAYNAIGAVDTVTYPASTGSPFVLKYLYSYGAAQQVKDNASGTVFWTLSATNDSSLPLTELLGNGVTVNSTYTPWTNELITRKEGTGGVSNSLQDLAYQWDPNGNLLQRKDQKQLPNQTEIFVHDALNRISSSTLNGNTNLTMGYDEAGNITSKSDAGTYDYTTQQGACSYAGLTAQPHAVRKAGTAVYCYDANGNATSRQGGALTWTSYNLPSAIAFGSNSTTFSYNTSRQRWKQDANYAGVHEVTYYIGGIMEKVTKGTNPTEYRHLIPAGSGSAILTRRSNLTNSTYYTTSDHLGSGDLVLDSTATVLVHESFTPFGARRGANWQGIPTTSDYTAFSNTTRRGFTGHEMLDSVGLVHMNGRVYDPTIGRFLSADPIIQTFALSQAINPFSYVMNQPLTLTDPSGMSWLSKLFSNIGHFLKKWGPLILGIVLTLVGVGPFFVALWSSLASAAINGGNFGSFITGFAIGLIAGAIAGPIGGKFSGILGLGGSGFVATVLRGAIVGGIAGGISSVAMGGTFGAGFAGGAIGGAISAAVSWRPETTEASAHDHKTSGDLNAKHMTEADYKAALQKAGVAQAPLTDGEVAGIDYIMADPNVEAQVSQLEQLVTPTNEVAALRAYLITDENGTHLYVSPAGEATGNSHLNIPPPLDDVAHTEVFDLHVHANGSSIPSPADLTTSMNYHTANVIVYPRGDGTWSMTYYRGVCVNSSICGGQ